MIQYDSITAPLGFCLACRCYIPTIIILLILPFIASLAASIADQAAPTTSRGADTVFQTLSTLFLFVVILYFKPCTQLSWCSAYIKESLTSFLTGYQAHCENSALHSVYIGWFKPEIWGKFDLLEHHNPNNLLVKKPNKQKLFFTWRFLFQFIFLKFKSFSLMKVLITTLTCLLPFAVLPSKFVIFQVPGNFLSLDLLLLSQNFVCNSQVYTHLQHFSESFFHLPIIFPYK